MTKFRYLAGGLALALAVAGIAQNRANWLLAEKYASSGLAKFVYSSNVGANYINDSDRFWYVWNDADGRRFMHVDPKSKKKARAFDHDKLAAALSEIGKKPVVGNQLPFTSIRYNKEETAISFTVERQNYEWNLKDETLKKVEGEAPAGGPPAGGPPGGGQGGPNRGSASTAPDKLAIVYSKGYNLFFGVKEKENEAVADVKAMQLTNDGEQFFEFTSVNYRTFTLGQKQDNPTAVGVNWAPDSKMFVVSRYDGRKIADLFVINSLANPRPTLEIYKYEMPGEENVEIDTLHIFDRETSTFKTIKADKWKDQSYYNVHWTGKGHDKLRFIRRDRLQRNLELCEYDTATEEIKVLFTESVENAYIELNPVRYVGDNNTGDIVWWSERSGWGHYYLYDHDGKLKNAITSGPWRAEGIVGLDDKSRTLWFSAVGKEAGENAYNTHHYSVKLDGTGMRNLNAGDANHAVSMSRSRDFIVDNYSRIDLRPKSVLRDGSGKIIMDLEEMDTSKLEEMGWKMPERFVVKSADGVTDIYGNMWKPFDFNPNKKYPIIMNIYPGPQTESVSNSFTPVSTLQELAQLGFIVIQIGNRGGTPQRSNAYHSYGYYNLRDYGLADKKAGVEQLGGRYPWIDVEKVGIFGHSGGGFMTAAAMLLPPYNDFFKVGVSSSGNHDNNMYNSNWSEQHHGLRIAEQNQQQQGGAGNRAGTGGRGVGRGNGGGPEEELLNPGDQDERLWTEFEWLQAAQQGGQGQNQQQKTESEREQGQNVKFEIKVPTTVELAPNLKGKMLIVTGDIDNNVHPGNTIRLADALIKANKRFDFMVMPGQRHGYGPMQNYFKERMFEYFAEYLLGDHYGRSADMPDRKG